MSNNLNVATAPKNTTFQMRINSDIKLMLEELFAQCGMTLTDAINSFFQQSLNVQGLPFLVNANGKELLKKLAFEQLMIEIRKAEESITSYDDLLSEEEVLKKFGVSL